MHAAPAPYILARALREAGHSCTVSEGTVNEESAAVLERIMMERADVVSFCCYIWNITAVLELAGDIKAIAPDTVIVLGGPEVSFCGEELLSRHLQIDYVLSGEGERTIPELVSGLLGGAPPKRGVLCDFGRTAPRPLPEEYIAALSGRIAYLETSRGCPFHCSFCLSGADSGVSYMPLQAAKAELLRLAKAGVRTVKLVDRTFNANGERAREIFAFLMENCGGFGTRFHFEVGADLFCEEDFLLLSQATAGLFQFEAGIQSLNAQVLAASGRKTETARLLQNLRRIISLKTIPLHVDLIAGLPREGLESFKESFDGTFALRPQMLQLGFLKLLHGSKFEREAAELGLVCRKYPPYEVLKTPQLGYSQLCLVKKTEWAVEKLYNSAKFLETVETALKSERSPFEFFCAVGELSGEKIDQFLFAEKLFLLLCERGVPKEPLISALLCDFLATDPCARLPKFLKKAVAERRAKFAENAPLPPLCAILEDGKIICADPLSRDSLNGRMKLI